jgi:hypothetical protein
MTATSAALVPAAPMLANAGRFAVAGFLAGYTGLTRRACCLHLRQFIGWCRRCRLRLVQARRAGIGCFARDLEVGGRARAAITRRLGGLSRPPSVTGSPAWP